METYSYSKDLFNLLGINPIPILTEQLAFNRICGQTITMEMKHGTLVNMQQDLAKKSYVIQAICACE